jgi:Bromodomain associated
MDHGIDEKVYQQPLFTNLQQQQHRRPRRDDAAYSQYIATKAVARAALHLGLECMSTSSLETLAACLLSYLERIGQTAAHAVEASGRSSAHTNVLDVIRAVEQCTSGAVARVHLQSNRTPRATDNVEDGATEDHLPMNYDDSLSPSEQLTWRGLAAFCFGPGWEQYQLPEEVYLQQLEEVDRRKTDNDKKKVIKRKSGGGKDAMIAAAAAASSSADAPDESGEGDAATDTDGLTSDIAADLPLTMPELPLPTGGWQVPFPAHVPLYPMVHGQPLVPMTKSDDVVDCSLWKQQAKVSPMLHASVIDLNNPHETLKPPAAVQRVDEAAAKRSGENADPDAMDVEERDEENDDVDTTPLSNSTQAANEQYEWMTQQNDRLMPDSLFGWWEGKPEADSKRGGSSDAVSSPAPKRVRIEAPNKTDQHRDAVRREADPYHPPYVPAFFPSFPRPPTDELDLQENITLVLDIGAEERNPSSVASSLEMLSQAPATVATSSVRSALVQLDPRASMLPDVSWGSTEWSDRQRATVAAFSVPPTNPASNQQQLDATVAPSAAIVPLGRASGNPVSRILEGSMDPATG